MKNKKCSLFVHHNIFLTREDRYKIIQDRQDLTVVGVSTPVWVFVNGQSSEPTMEIFCEYTLTNNEANSPITKSDRGYIINLPQKQIMPKLIPTISEWTALTVVEKENWYQDNSTTPNCNNLLDLQDKGGEYLRFVENNQQKINDVMIYLSHTVEIKDIKYLKDSLIMGSLSEQDLISS